MTTAHVENIELDSGQRDRSINLAPTIAIERPKTAANAPEGATTRAIEAGKTLNAACANVRMYKIADDRRRQKPNCTPTGKSRLRVGWMWKRPKTGFTLVELLVVIGIIGVLIGILLPVLSKARNAALTVQCMSNMRQDGLAVSQYIEDSHGFLPPYCLEGNYPAAAEGPYIFRWLPSMYQTASAQTWVCPADNLQVIQLPGEVGPQRGPYLEFNGARANVYYSYAVNGDQPLSRSLLYPATGSSYYNPGLAMKVQHSASFMFLFETRQDALQEYSQPANYFRFNHRGNSAMNVLLLDGHVDTMTSSEIFPSPQWTSAERALWFGSDTATSQLLF
jgi:prepilin-type N-terminal cleavage/methylation domain-containing protein/prepilin-type processing-associated H-X9-DG protein